MTRHLGEETGTERVVAYLRTESIESANSEVVSELRRRVVDTLGAISAGHRVDGTEVTTAYVRDAFSGGDSTILDGSGRRLRPEGAAFANALAGNALDIDDGNRLTEGHPAAVVIPAALAVAEERDVTVRELLDAVLAGYEIAVRTALVLKEWTGMYNGSGSWGSVGAAAAATRLRGAGPETAEHALSIAEFNTPIAPVMRSVANPGSAVTKDGIGWGCYVGTVATELAGRGLTGSGTVFDEDDTDTEHVTTLGEKYFVTESYYKPHPGCRWTHSGIDAVLSVLHDHELETDDIEEIHVHSHWKATELGTRRPANPDEAEYSYPFLLAAAIVKGDWLAPSDLNEETRTDPTVLDLVDQITLHRDEDAQAAYPDRSMTRVEISTGESTYESSLTSPLGSRERPLSAADHRKKQAILIDDYYGEGTANEVRSIVEDDDASVQELLELFTE